MLKPVRVVGALACAVALSVAVTSTASAADGHERGRDRGRILYWQYNADFSATSMVSIRPDGSGRVVLDPGAPAGALDYSPHWDATGRHVTFFRVVPGGADGEEGSSDVWRMRADGTHARQVTHLGDVENPVSSPDGTLIAFEREVAVGGTAERDIWLVDADGSHLRNLTRTPGVAEIWPRWASQGHRLAYSTQSASGSYDIVLDDLHRHVTTIAADPAANEIVATFSPRNRRVAYTRSADGSRGIYVNRLGGKQKPKLVVAGGAYADWSPDGGRLAVVTRDADGASRLITVRPDGTRIRTAVTGSDALYEPDWSPRA